MMMDLLECLSGKDEHRTYENRRQHALEIIRSGGYIHSVTEHNETCLHLAIREHFLDVVPPLLKKGIDVNTQDWEGNTALHKICYYGSREVELVPMLLYHGADPWIRNNRKATPLDLIIISRFRLLARSNCDEKWDMVATIECLYHYMFDGYTEFGISVDALLKAADLDLPFFREMVRTIKEIDVDNLGTLIVDIKHIFTMPSENLRLLLDKFDYVFITLFRLRYLPFLLPSRGDFRHENIYILVESDVRREFIHWLCRWKLTHRIFIDFFRNPAPREEIFYHLLSYGMEISRKDIEIVYRCCGYNELFKLLRFMDVKDEPRFKTQLIPRLVFEVTGDIQTNIEDPRFWVKHMNEVDFSPVLPYYAVPNLKDLRCEVEVEGQENFFEKLCHQPRVPLLVEMARNVFRKYFVQRLRITSAMQFYESLELLPISSHHRKIIALETELY